MYKTCVDIKDSEIKNNLGFKRFELSDEPIIRGFVDRFQPESCEYNFTNLFCWQGSYDYSWTTFKDRLVIYDGLNKCIFMPLGKKLNPEELMDLSLNMIKADMSPDVGIVQAPYLSQTPGIRDYYTVEEERDSAEYIYSVERLCELNGSKLHKKRNLISQFLKQYPENFVKKMSGELQSKSFNLARDLVKKINPLPQSLEQEMAAFEQVFSHFDQLGFEGLVLMVDEKVAAFSIFTKLNDNTYNVQFEKSDQIFKGAAQVINRETARYLRSKCRWINREQAPGIKGLRQAKMSYEPEKLLTPSKLVFNIPN